MFYYQNIKIVSVEVIMQMCSKNDQNIVRFFKIKIIWTKLMNEYVSNACQESIREKHKKLLKNL